MGNFNKEIYMKGCRLITKVDGDTSNMYQFVFNPETAEFSDIFPCGNGLEFELEEDGVYKIVTLKVDNAQITDTGLTIGTRDYSIEELVPIIDGSGYYRGINVGIYDIDEILSICKLKKCLAALELQVFQDMLKNCGKTLCKTNDVKSQRDFLFIAVWLIEHYIELGNIEMAQSIYERIKGCGNLCQNLLNDKKNCGCNG